MCDTSFVVQCNFIIQPKKEKTSKNLLKYKKRRNRFRDSFGVCGYSRIVPRFCKYSESAGATSSCLAGFQIRTLYRASTNSFRTLNPGISDLLVILKFLNNFLNTIRRIQQSADGGIVIQLVDDESDIFAQVAADVVLAGEKLGVWYTTLVVRTFVKSPSS